MLKELEKAIQDDLDKGLPDFKGPRAGPTIVQQLLSVAESVKTAQADIDAMQDEYNVRISDIIDNVQDALNALREDLARRCDALRQNMGVRP